jgi:hypothetical protein
MRLSPASRRRRPAIRDFAEGPKICVSAVNERLLVSAHGALDASSVEELRHVVVTAIDQVERAENVEIDIRRVPSCSPEGLGLIARLVERGVRLWTDELQIQVPPEGHAVRFTGTETR